MRVTDLIPWRRGGNNAPAMNNRSQQFGLLQSDINRALESFWRQFDLPMFGDSEPATAGLAFAPVDVRDTGRAVEVKVELPGMDDADMDVGLVDGALIVRAEKKVERDQDDNAFTLRDLSCGMIERMIPLPDELDHDAAKADFRNGVLTVTIPKTAAAQRGAKRIPVRQQ